METKDIILSLRTKSGLSQEELAEKVFVTRQAVSRWEKGETIPNTETLKLLSKLFSVSIDTILGSHQTLICRCCGTPVDEMETEKYRNCCYIDGEFPLDFWKQYAKIGGEEMFHEFKNKLIRELNELKVEGLPQIDDLNVLPGGFVNLEYRLPNGNFTKFLDDNKTYLGTQVECEFGGCFGVVAGADFLLMCTYDEGGKNPELVIYKRR